MACHLPVAELAVMNDSGKRGVSDLWHMLLLGMG